MIHHLPDGHNSYYVAGAKYLFCRYVNDLFAENTIVMELLPSVGTQTEACADGTKQTCKNNSMVKQFWLKILKKNLFCDDRKS